MPNWQADALDLKKPGLNGISKSIESCHLTIH